jgi:hypothetical protein
VPYLLVRLRVRPERHPAQSGAIALRPPASPRPRARGSAFARRPLLSGPPPTLNDIHQIFWGHKQRTTGRFMSQALLPSKHAQWFAVLHKHWFLEADVKTSPEHDSKPRAWIGDNAVELPRPGQTGPLRLPRRKAPGIPLPSKIQEMRFNWFESAPKNAPRLPIQTNNHMQLVNHIRT